MAVLSFEEALKTVLAQAGKVRAGPAERVPLLESVGRVLAERVAADRDQPPFDRSTRDGFAVRAEDVRPKASLPKASLRVLGQIRAGQRWMGDPIEAGSAIEIMTGAPLPEGADAVIMIEHVD